MLGQCDEETIDNEAGHGTYIAVLTMSVPSKEVIHLSATLLPSEPFLGYESLRRPTDTHMDQDPRRHLLAWGHHSLDLIPTPRPAAICISPERKPRTQSYLLRKE